MCFSVSFCLSSSLSLGVLDPALCASVSVSMRLLVWVSPLISSSLDSLCGDSSVCGFLWAGIPGSNFPSTGDLSLVSPSPCVSRIHFFSLQLCGSPPMPRICDLRVSRRWKGPPDGRECPDTWFFLLRPHPRPHPLGVRPNFSCYF